MLKKLPICGDWLDPETITAVLVHPGYKASMGCPEGLPRVCIHHGGNVSVIECEVGDEQARVIRDEIAAWVK